MRKKEVQQLVAAMIGQGLTPRDLRHDFVGRTARLMPRPLAEEAFHVCPPDGYRHTTLHRS
jgi:hypothetical protein